MIPISLYWDSREKSIRLKWDGFISSRWRNGKISTRVLRIPIPFRLKMDESRLSVKPPMRWVYLKGIFSFLGGWKLKEMEGTLSFSDPMVNGVLYGWMSAFQTRKSGRKVRLTVNFSGENSCRGEATLSLSQLFYHLRSWILPFICEMRRRKSRKGGARRNGSH